jgi:GxxExxY protein
MLITKKYLNDLTYEILGCAIEVHRQLGPGLLERIYEKCLARELAIKGIPYEFQQTVPLCYKGLDLEADLRYDLLIDNLIITEIKSNEGILPVHEAVLLTYMRLLEKPKGIIINFNCTNIFKEGQKTFVNNYFDKLVTR